MRKAWTSSPGLLVWMAPVVLGLLLAGPVSWLTSRRAGAFARWALSTVEDRRPAPVLIAASGRAAEWAARRDNEVRLHVGLAEAHAA